MKVARTSRPNRRRSRRIAAGAILLVLVSYVMSVMLHREAIREMEASRRHLARSEWLAAIRCLDRARWEDPYLLDAYLLRATAINGQFPEAIHPRDRMHSRADALADADWYLRYRPESGEAHYQRGTALAGLGEVEPARQELARAIALMADPTPALLGRAWLSFHTGDPKGAIEEITAAIERHPLVPDFYEARAYYRMIRPGGDAERADRLRAELLRESPGLSREELERRVELGMREAPGRGQD